MTSLNRFIALTFLCGALLAAATTASAQVLITNSMVSYTYQQNPADSYVPSAPLTSEVPYSTLDFSPSGLVASSSGAGVQIDTQTAILTLDMIANSGMWFSGANAFSLNLSGSYSMTAPFSISEAFTSVTSSYNLSVQQVDGAAFGAFAPMSGNLTILPTNSFSLVGPGSVASGSWNGTLTLDINTIKTHFGIAAGSNITGMRLQQSTTLSAASINGSGSIDVLSLNVANQVVPEPSTYALLALAAAALGAHVLRRRRN